MDQVWMEAQWSIYQTVAWITGENKVLEFVFLLAGIAVGFTFRRNPEPMVQDTDFKEQLVVSQNLNASLLQDLEQAKETIRKLKNAS